ncbi:hypothetical protein L2Y96_20545 [Luteibacter aegosomaticola]|jgi:hypothetical protein|uniref:hypothetical protein n=1 Tax=Luteibacter aegosomaticola TaxID=2911538 RepID=UPI001FFB2D3C|nr:hypothetical protein [Luteibacter aegosomaticola]UPG89751.1 hypothetical protein L2Y96_20545 [Luteibacter aegosomaticola]
MKPSYPRKAVDPVSVKPAGSNEVSLRYHVYPESSYYSGGVDYTVDAGVLKVVIGRCKVGSTCESMAKTNIPLDDEWQAQVTLPYHGEKIVVVHADGDEQVYP